MNETIDIRDLCVGSYVQDVNGQIVTVSALSLTQLTGTTNSLTSKGEWVYSLENLTPIPITPEWLITLGFTDTSDEYGPEWSWQWNEEFNVNNYQVLRIEDQYLITCDTHFLAHLDGIHHLQQLLWSLERVWLTLDKKEVSRES